MPKYIFYTVDGYTESPNRVEVNNCQVLGWEQGATVEEAKTKLLKNNKWVEETGFNINTILSNELKDKY